MGRHKKEISKVTRMQFRVEKTLKEDYILSCKKRNIIYSERLREFIINDLKKIQNG